MPGSDLLRQWLHTSDDPLTLLLLALISLISTTVGAVLASLATCLEDYLSTSREEGPDTTHSGGLPMSQPIASPNCRCSGSASPGG
jgi:hypothetical protein